MNFYGQWDPPVDKVLFENYFKNHENGFFIEAGAYDGVNLSCCLFFEKFMNWKGINVEPAKDHFNLLSKNRPNSININMGLSDSNKTLKFKNVTSKKEGSGNGSFEFSKNHLNELKNYKVTFEEYDVDTISYSDLIDRMNVKNVDLMCLDVEGFEFKVLDGMKKVLPNVMCIEYSYIGLENLKSRMKSLGYIYDMISFNNAYFHHSSKKFDIPKFGQTFDEYSVLEDGSWKLKSIK
jgi:FkbM family methyltransferase